jgi:5,10-methylene-tetrahydrofolate dehydrogenase/methenyl tetrahydrofolate cyclohydrolase
VDGLHPNNVGRLAMRGVWRPAFMPCAPLGCAELLRREGVDVRGKAVAVVGDSNVVGMPMSWLMRDAGAASTTLLHTQAVDFLKAYRDMDPRERRSTETRRARDDALRAVRDADVVVVGVGAPEIVTRDWVKPGAVVVDIGINAVPLLEDSKTGVSANRRLENQPSPSEPNAYSLPGRAAFSVVGDVHAEDVSRVAGAMTSVPGGAGPMTIAALLSNTFLGASRRDRRAA